MENTKKHVIMKTELLCKSYVSDGEINNVIKNIDLEIYKEDFTVIMGSSGSGKSTLLYLLSGMLEATGGTVSLLDKKITGLKEKELSMIRKNQIGFVFQAINLVSELNVYENIISPAYKSKVPKEEQAKRVLELAEAVGLKDQIKKFPSQLSGGQRQRVAICRALMNEPEILFADDTVELSYDGEDGIRKFRERKPKLMILDIMLPKKDGVEVLKEVRTMSDIPIIMLSAKAGEMDKVISLGAGADDYVTKPFSPMELVARVKAQMRRYGSLGKNGETKQEKTVGKLTFYPASYEVYVGEEQLILTTKEFEMLSFFADNLNQVFSKEQIYENVWGANEHGDISSVAVYIRRIRNKLEAYHLDYIKTIWGAGYKMTVEKPE